MGIRFAAWLAAIGLAATPICAAAQTWTTASVGKDKSEWQIDTSHVTSSGPMAEIWVKVIQPHPKLDPVSQKYFRTTVAHRLVNCSNNTYADIAVINYDDHGLVLSSFQVPVNAWQYTASPGGSIGDQVNQAACGIIARRAALTAAVPLKPTDPLTWRQIGFVTGGLLTDVAMESIQRHGSQAAFVERLVGPQTSPGKLSYQTSLALLVEDCDRHELGMLSIDYYDQANVLVESRSVTPQKMEFDPIPPNSVADAALQIVCAAPDAKTDSGGFASGTGWEGPKGYLVTAAHVVKGADQIFLYQAGQLVGAAEVVAEDPVNDLAVLKPKFTAAGHRVVIALSERPAVLGERVFTLGFPAPNILGASIKVTSGEVSATAGSSQNNPEDHRFLQISAPIQPGNSGGPVIGPDGRVVGVVISAVEHLAGDPGAPQNINFAMKISYLRTLLDDLPDLGDEIAAPRPASQKAAALTHEALVGRLQDSVFLLLIPNPKPDE